jgi:hypothetical protein
MTAGAQITQICAHTGGTLTRQPAAPNGGSGAAYLRRQSHSVIGLPVFGQFLMAASGQIQMAASTGPAQD